MSWLSRRAACLLLGTLGTPLASPAQANVLGQASSIALGRVPVRVAIVEGPLVATRIRALPSGHRLILVARRLRAAAPPGVLYRLLLDLDPGAALPGEKDPRDAGIINFYAAVPPGGNPSTVSFDITANLRAILAKGGLAHGLTVTIAPMETPADGADAAIGALELVEEQ